MEQKKHGECQSYHVNVTDTEKPASTVRVKVTGTQKHLVLYIMSRSQAHRNNQLVLYVSRAQTQRNQLVLNLVHTVKLTVTEKQLVLYIMSRSQTEKPARQALYIMSRSQKPANTVHTVKVSRTLSKS